METNKTLKERERRKIVIDILGGCCINCQSTEELEIAHINPEEKSFDVSGGALRKSMEVILEELQKCQLMCKTCNKEKKRIDMGKQEPTHGTASMYTNKKCRCDACRAAWNVYSKKYTEKYRKNNPELIRAKQMEYLERKRKEDPEGLTERLRLASRTSKAKSRKKLRNS